MALADVPEELVRRCQQDKPGAFDELFELIHEDTYRFAYSLVRDHDDAMEILQECLLRMYRHLPRLQEPARFGSWASRLIVNQANTYRSKSNRTRTEELEEGLEAGADALPLQGAAPPNPRGAASRNEVLQHVNRAIRELPPKQRTAVTLFDVKGWSMKQIAEYLGCSEGAVKYNVFQARRKLRELLRDYVDENGNPVYDSAE